MGPKLDYCADEIHGINTEQKFIRTILQKHDTTLEFHSKDLSGLGTQVDQLQINQTIYKASAHAAGEPIKWATFVEFLVVLPKYWKGIVAALLSLISVLTMAWELLRKK